MKILRKAYSKTKHDMIRNENITKYWGNTYNREDIEK